MPQVAEVLLDALWKRQAELGLTQRALAEKLGISEEHLSRLKHGDRHVTTALAQAIIRFLPELTLEALAWIRNNDR